MLALKKRKCSWLSLSGFLSPLFSVLLLLLPVTSYSWNATGHMVVADIAYQQLSPVARSKVDVLIGTLNKEYPNVGSMMNMAAWPDSIRGQRIEIFTHWHYINLPYSSDGTIPKYNIDTDNAVWAVKQIRNIVKNEHANPYERARFLAFLVHITGDLHQPLHAVSLFSQQHPAGDRGGNLYKIRYNSKVTNAHKLWDQGVTAFDVRNTSPEKASEIAATIMQLYPPTSFSNKALFDLDPDDWAQESLVTAKKFVYKVPEDTEPSSSYIQHGTQEAEKQAALAGYRLGNLLNSLLG